MIDFLCPECDEEMEVSDRMAGKKVRCVACDAKIVVPDGPSRPEGRPQRRRGRSRPPSLPTSELRQVALYQKAILFCILAYILAIPTQFLLPPGLRPFLLIFVLAVAIAGMVFVFLLALKLYNVGIGVLLGILSLIPLVGLIILLVINGKATSLLQLAGYKVGLLGANLSQFDKAEEEEE